MKKINLGASIVLLLTILLIPASTFASTKNTINKQSNEIYEPDKPKGNIDELLQKEDLYEPAEEPIPYQEVPKIKDKDIKLVEGGNEKAINPLATKENKARGTVIENVDRQNKDITPKTDTIEENNTESKTPEKTEAEKENKIDMRQFLTFQTKSGKTFHLIVDHGENEENVQLLTEVGEQDLLNMIEGKSSAEKKENVKKVEPIKKEELKAEKKEEKKSGIGLYLFIGLIIIGVLGAGYYFKIYKKKQGDDVYDEDEEEYDELEDDYELENELNNEPDIGDTEDDTAINLYDDEDDEE